MRAEKVWVKIGAKFAPVSVWIWVLLVLKGVRV